MAISLKTRILLWGRSGNLCSYPGCNCKLIQDATPSDDESLVADCCHIYADSDNGPRANVALTQEERDSYDNIILLCKVHHKLVDDQRKTYNPELLKKLKNEHESKIENAIVGQNKKQLQKEMSVAVVEKLFDLLDIDNWENWTSSFFSAGQPYVRVEMFNRMMEARKFIFIRDQDSLTTNIKKSLKIVFEVLSDLIEILNKHKIKEQECYIVEKFYKSMGWNENYESDLKRYNAYIYIIEDYVTELTRSLNYLINTIRLDLYPYYRFFQGMLAIETDITDNMKYYTYVPVYNRNEKYKRDSFIDKDRFDREIHFGKKEDKY